MAKTLQVENHSKQTLDRLIPRLQDCFESYANENPDDWAEFLNRLEIRFERLFSIFLYLYQDQDDFSSITWRVC